MFSIQHDNQLDQFHHAVKSRVFLQEPPTTTRKIHQLKNRTSEAGNDSIVIFNRVPKTGSEMLQSFGKYLAATQGYHAFIDPQIMKLFPSHQDQMDFVKNFKEQVNDSGIYFRHMTYFDFTDYSMMSPIYASIVRHPVDRMVSWFYYQRWKDRPDDEMPSVCTKNSKWRQFCDEMLAIRQEDFKRDESWFNMTFDECIEKKLPECQFSTGNGYLLQKDFKMDFRSQMMFFCGNNLQCSLFNSQQVLNMAKQIVEEKYAVVGILEDLEATFQALQAYIPKFFRNAHDLFQENLNNLTLTHTNKNPGKLPLNNQTRQYLEQKFNVEIEFYEFCKQRLYQQLEQVEKIDRSINWPDQIAKNEIIADDDYLLL